MKVFSFSGATWGVQRYGKGNTQTLQKIWQPLLITTIAKEKKLLAYLTEC